MVKVNKFSPGSVRVKYTVGWLADNDILTASIVRYKQYNWTTMWLHIYIFWSNITKFTFHLQGESHLPAETWEREAVWQVWGQCGLREGGLRAGPVRGPQLLTPVPVLLQPAQVTERLILKHSSTGEIHKQNSFQNLNLSMEFPHFMFIFWKRKWRILHFPWKVHLPLPRHSEQCQLCWM